MNQTAAENGDARFTDWMKAFAKTDSTVDTHNKNCLTEADSNKIRIGSKEHITAPLSPLSIMSR